MGLAVAIPPLLAWIPLLRREERPTWFLAPTLAAVAFGIWADPLETFLVAEAGVTVVAVRALSRVLLLVVLPILLLLVFGGGHLVPGAPALGLGREGVGESVGWGLAASVVLVPLVWLALRGVGAAPTPTDALPFVVVEAVAEEVFFRGILLVPLVGVLGRWGAFAVGVSSFVLTRPMHFVDVAASALLPRPMFALAVLAVAVLLSWVSLRTRSAAGPCLARSLARVVPQVLL